jgi:hypothetical protein
MHPFPIFERYIDEDIIINNELIIKSPAQVIIFVFDIMNNKDNLDKNNAIFPIFGAGSRICPGNI